MQQSRVHLYIATSLDGYIADRNGNVDWLLTDQEYGFNDFFDTIESVVMGRKTYEKILEFEDRSVFSKDVYVCSNFIEQAEHPDVTIVDFNIPAFIKQLKEQSTKDIWLMGGGNLVTTFRKNTLINLYSLFVHPVLLGDGIPLFDEDLPTEQLETTTTRQFDSGLIQLSFRRI